MRISCRLKVSSPTTLGIADADEAAEGAAAAASTTAAADVQAALVKRVLPALAEQLIVKNEVRTSQPLGFQSCYSPHL